MVKDFTYSEEEFMKYINDAMTEHVLRTGNGSIYSKLYECGLTFATMESCTGGSLASTFTDIEGSTRWFRGGIVSYTTDVKIQFGVPEETIQNYTVYSKETAEAMAKVASEKFDADIGIGITGQFPFSRSCVQFGDTKTHDSVYISLYDKRNGKYYNNTISVGDQEDRIAQKNYVCNEVCEMLWIEIFHECPFVV